MAEPVDKERAARIKELRKARGVTQGGLAELAGVSERAVQVWEAGGNIEWPNLVAAARVLNTTPLYIQNGPAGASGSPPVREEELADLIDRLAQLLAEGGDRRKGDRMRDLQVSKRIAEMRGEDEAANLSSLRADVQALSTEMQALVQAVRELRRQQRDPGQSGRGDSQQEVPGGP